MRLSNSERISTICLVAIIQQRLAVAGMDLEALKVIKHSAVYTTDNNVDRCKI